jgi:hypothetical protein
MDLTFARALVRSPPGEERKITGGEMRMVATKTIKPQRITGQLRPL